MTMLRHANGIFLSSALILAACGGAASSTRTAAPPAAPTLAANYAAQLRGAAADGASAPSETLADAHARAAEAPAAPEIDAAPAAAALIPDIADARSVLFGVHLASYRSDEAAARGWDVLRAAAPEELGGLSPRIEVVDLGEERGVYRRLKAGPLASRAEAETRCQALQAAGFFCEATNFTGAAPPR